MSSEILSSRSVRLTWGLPLPEKRNGEITGYTITIENVDTGESFELSTTERTLIVDTLRPYMNYQFIVAASTEVGQGPSTLEISILTPEDGNYFFECNIYLYYTLCTPSHLTLSAF